MRLDAYLAQQYPGLSRSQLQQYIRSGRVLVDGQTVNKPSLNVENNSQIIFHQPMTTDWTNELANFTKYVVYQDDNVIVINKPAGMLVHAKGGIVPEFTVADYVRSQFDSAELSGQDGNNRIGIVHRLDRATSGVMIAARNLATASLLSRQFAERRAHKTYLAVVEHPPKEEAARIELPIARDLKRPATFCVNGQGKPAVTDYRVLRHNSDGTALLELKPQTGRTHQLRVHLAYLGCPIVGDPIYGGRSAGKQLVAADRLMLHAWQLEITIPGQPHNQRRTFVAPVPAEFDYDGGPDCGGRA